MRPAYSDSAASTASGPVTGRTAGAPERADPPVSIARPAVAATPSPALPPSTLAADRSEIRALTGLRLLAAAWVVVFHFDFTKGHLVRAVLDPLHFVVTTGAMGVDLFYVLSGFVIGFTYLNRMGPALRPRVAGRFLWARVCRIWPVYALVTVLFGAYLVAKSIRLHDPAPAYQRVQPGLDPLSWLRQLGMVQIWGRPWHDGASFVGPAWSISAEWLAYVLFPLAALAFFRMSRWPRWLLGSAAVALMGPVAVLCLLTGSPYFPYSWAVRILCGFAAGVLVYLVVREVPRTERVRRLAGFASWALLGAILAGLVLGEWLGPVGTSTERGGVVLVLFPPLVGALALASGGGSWPDRLLSTGPVVHGGRISYSLYLVHVPVFEVCWAAMDRLPAFHANGVPGTVLTPLALVCVFVAAHLLYRFVEEPARRLLRR